MCTVNLIRYVKYFIVSVTVKSILSSMCCCDVKILISRRTCTYSGSWNPTRLLVHLFHDNTVSQSHGGQAMCKCWFFFFLISHRSLTFKSIYFWFALWNSACLGKVPSEQQPQAEQAEVTHQQRWLQTIEYLAAVVAFELAVMFLRGAGGHFCTED